MCVSQWIVPPATSAKGSLRGEGASLVGEQLGLRVQRYANPYTPPDRLRPRAPGTRVSLLPQSTGRERRDSSESTEIARGRRIKWGK